jgi:hypothetical protein
MKQIIIYKTEKEKPLDPCQLKKLWGSGHISCSFDCAISQDCPIFYIDEHNQPIIKKFDSDKDPEPIV